MTRKLFVLDTSVLKAIIEGDDSKKTVKMFNLMKKIKESDKSDVRIVTTMPSLLRAIHLSDESTKIERLQDIIETIVVMPTNADFRSEKDVMEDLVIFAGQTAMGVGE